MEIGALTLVLMRQLFERPLNLKLRKPASEGTEVSLFFSIVSIQGDIDMACIFLTR